jgi:hypothetical protein
MYIVIIRAIKLPRNYYQPPNALQIVMLNVLATAEDFLNLEPES